MGEEVWEGEERGVMMVMVMVGTGCWRFWFGVGGWDGCCVNVGVYEALLEACIELKR